MASDSCWEPGQHTLDLMSEEEEDTGLGEKGGQGWIWEEWKGGRYDQNMVYKILKELIK